MCLSVLEIQASRWLFSDSAGTVPEHTGQMTKPLGIKSSRLADGESSLWRREATGRPKSNFDLSTSSSSFEGIDG